MEDNRRFRVTNRSGSKVVYKIPELNNLRREYAPGEYRDITYHELELLSFQPGGAELMQHYLRIEDQELIDALNIHTEPEYFWGDEEVIEALTSMSLDRFKDALEFAPDGTKQLIKDWAVKLPLNDVAKREAMKEMWRFDVAAAVQHDREDKATDEVVTHTNSRRAPTEEPTRRRDPQRESKYSVKA